MRTKRLRKSVATEEPAKRPVRTAVQRLKEQHPPGSSPPSVREVLEEVGPDNAERYLPGVSHQSPKDALQEMLRQGEMLKSRTVSFLGSFALHAEAPTTGWDVVEWERSVESYLATRPRHLARFQSDVPTGGLLGFHDLMNPMTTRLEHRLNMLERIITEGEKYPQPPPPI